MCIRDSECIAPDSLRFIESSQIHKDNYSPLRELYPEGNFYLSYADLQFLLKIISRPELEEYYDSLITPILKYDKKYNSNLLETLKIYVECNLDHIKTGELLHIHKNTVRYRLSKIKELIPYGMSPLDFNFSLY